MDDVDFDDEDLVAANPSDRNWKGIIIAVIVISSVLTLIVTSVYLLTPPDEGPRIKGRRFELEDIFSPEFQPYRINGTWVSDNEWIFRDTSGGVSLFNAHNNSVRSLISNFTFRRFDAKLSSISPDLQYALLVHDIRQINRYSNSAKYTLYTIETGRTDPLSIERNITEGDVVPHSTLQLVKWSPVGSAIVLVHEGDIYYRPNPKNRTTHRLTNTAVPGVIYNGIPDWLYEEEILESNSALWFSSDGQQLLYMVFNDTLVGNHALLQYGDIEEPFLYPQVKNLRYPKPGTNNPTVAVKVVELRQSRGFREQELLPPEGMSSQEYYVTAGGWVKSTEVGIIWTSRSYNLSIISVCSTKNGSCEEMYRIPTEKRGWVERVPFPYFTSSPSSRNFITIAPVRDGENGFFDHLVLVDTVNKRSHPITHGSMDVIKINAWDEERNLIYFLAIPAEMPKERRFYRLKIEQPYTEHSPECLSCEMTSEPPSLGNGTGSLDETKSENPKLEGTGKGGIVTGRGKSFGVTTETGPTEEGSGEDNYHLELDTNVRSDQETEQQLGKDKLKPGDESTENNFLGSNKSCSFVTSVRFSSAKNYFVLECGGPDIPYVALYAASSSNLRLIQMLQTNDALRNLSSGMAFPQVQIEEIKLSTGQTVQVRILLPPGLRKKEITKYPLILHVYGGPGTQLALDRWGVDFASYLASKKDYIVVQVDSRGSGGRGWDYQHQVYHKVGILEAEDQIDAVRALLEDKKNEYHYIEKRKMGVWGWSYGGYLTAMIMANKDSNDLFQCGASVAPVTNWKLYDSAYTERYMGLPNITGNYRGYAESDVTQNVDNFENKMFYLLHGTADDNVHVQHSMLLAKALIAKKILFRQQIYPDESHSLKGVQLHVHKSLEGFFEDCFRKKCDMDLETGLNQGGNPDDEDEDEKK